MCDLEFNSSVLFLTYWSFSLFNGCIVLKQILYGKFRGDRIFYFAQSIEVSYYALSPSCARYESNSILNIRECV